MKKITQSLLLTIYRLKILPRWVIIIIDLFIIALSTALGYLLRFNFNVTEILKFHFFEGIELNVLFGFISILITSSYKGIVRYAGIQDSVRIFYMLTLTLVFLSSCNFLYNLRFGLNLIPLSVIIISFLASFLLLFNYRLMVKYVFSFYNRSTFKNANVLIFGAGQTGMITKHVIESSRLSKVVGFIDDDVYKVGKILNGTRIYPTSTTSFENLILGSDIQEFIITVSSLSVDRKNELVDICLRNHVKVRIVPPVDKWIKGELSFGQIKEINIEDLLERESIRLDNPGLEAYLRNKRICITGAGGSIGSEICRQVSHFSPAGLVLIDQAESALFEIDREIKASRFRGNLFSYVADITDLARIRAILGGHKPDIIFHAAAYKHVPMMENNPSEAVTCNILGTKILADLAVECKVEKFVMISTDKAVNPTNVMGCSKRIAEVYVQSLNHFQRINGDTSPTSFVTTRFGNVLGSNGSVIPVFKKQIAQGGPVTVTHPEITRYFMTIPEACQLVLEAGAMGKGGEVFIFDMGRTVKIHDLARRMILLSGLEPNRDIDIVFTGLREGEKLFEELLTQQENSVPTHHEKILIAQVQEYSYTEINKYVELFYELVNDRNELKMVALMKELVPEFKSNYSRFEVLDKLTA